jgi:GAF domain-containing protein
MLRSGDMLGVIMIYRHEVSPFTESQVALIETFADQAAIGRGWPRGQLNA